MTPDLATFVIGIAVGLMLGRPDIMLKLREGIKKQRENFRPSASSALQERPPPPL